MRRSVAIAFSVVALTQSGFTCGPGVPPPGVRCEDGAAPATREIQLGQADADGHFAPLSEDQVYPPEWGSQGGQHIFVAVRFYAEEGEEEWGHGFHVLDDGGVEFGSRYVIEPSCAPGWTVVDGIRVFVDPGDRSTATLEVESGPLGPQGEPLEVVRASGTIHLR